jgi:hypothetical protein
MINPKKNMIGPVAGIAIGALNLDLEDELKPEYKGHPISFWTKLQHLHDDRSNWNFDGGGLTDIGKSQVAGIKATFDLQ